ncbi:MAG: Glu-tRNA(Gln) amidotransferase subunit GatE [archaeon]
MPETDYSKLGLKCGLEIHQQLDTNKLFCNCPSLLRKDEPDFVVKRKLHAVAGESGEVDIAAKHEASLGKEFIYQGYDTTCLVELDEEPPHEINPEALKIALHISLLLNCKIMPLTQIMRKTVIDGSNTSGFQRTVLIARDGYIKTPQGRVGIWYVYLEEDAARTIEEEKEKKVYRLDRLGTPLVEIVTAPDITSPSQAKEVALQIGNILRSAKVKRGIGTIRQDINVSIIGHPRAEIKGFQDPKIFVSVVENEIKRQLDDLSKKKKNLIPEVRGANPNSTTKFLRPMPGEARMYPETDLPLLKIHKNLINEAKKTLPILRSDLEKDLQKTGLHQEMINLLMKHNKIDEFKNLLKIINKPQLIAKVLLVFPKQIASHRKLKISTVEKRIEDNLADVLNLVAKGRISESQVYDVIEKIVSGEKISDIKFEKADTGDVEERIHKIIKSKPGLSPNAYMGLVMKEMKGKIDGKEAMKFIRKFIK